MICFTHPFQHLFFSNFLIFQDFLFFSNFLSCVVFKSFFCVFFLFLFYLFLSRIWISQVILIHSIFFHYEILRNQTTKILTIKSGQHTLPLLHSALKNKIKTEQRKKAASTSPSFFPLSFLFLISFYQIKTHEKTRMFCLLKSSVDAQTLRW